MRSEGDVGGPAAEAAVLVDGLYPLGEVGALGALLLGVLALDLQHERGALGELDQEVRAVLVNAALPDVDDLEAEVGLFFAKAAKFRLGVGVRTPRAGLFSLV